MLGIFSEQQVDSGTKPRHSFYYPSSPTTPASSLPSYFPGLTAHLPKHANSVKVTNLRPEQDYLSLVRQCQGRLWEDPAFPADSRVLTDGNMVVSYFGR